MKTYCEVDDPPKYCHICGKALVMRARRKEFDIYAGNEIIEQRLECTVPNHDEWVKEDKFYHNIKRE